MYILIQLFWEFPSLRRGLFLKNFDFFSYCRYSVFLTLCIWIMSSFSVQLPNKVKTNRNRKGNRSTLSCCNLCQYFLATLRQSRLKTLTNDWLLWWHDIARPRVYSRSWRYVANGTWVQLVVAAEVSIFLDLSLLSEAINLLNTFFNYRGSR